MKSILSILIVLSSQFSFSQFQISGTVVDSITNEALPYIKIYAKRSKQFVESDDFGNFSIDLAYEADTLVIRDISYIEKKLPIVASQDFTIKISEHALALDEIVVRPGEHPALRILKKVRENRSENDPSRVDAYQCETYSKMQFDLNNLSERFKQRKLVQKFDFILDYIDSSDGTQSLPVLFSETVSDVYFKSSPVSKKEVIKATRVVGVEELNLTQFTGDLQKSINIYDYQIGLLGRSFVSPIAPSAKGFYRFHLNEDDTISGKVIAHISFSPRRSGTAVFSGDLWVDETTSAIVKVAIDVPDGINLNYLKGFRLEQTFIEVQNRYMVEREVVTAKFALIANDKSQLAGVTVRKDVTRSNFIIGEEKNIRFYAQKTELDENALVRSEDYWNDSRKQGLTAHQGAIEEMVDSLKRNRTFKLLEKSAHFAFTGYWKTKPIEIGNLYSIYGRNVVEGNRFQLTMRTSKSFSRKLRFTGFAAYGTKDKQWKYGGSARLKLNSNSFSVIEASYKRNIDQLGLGKTRLDFGRSLALLVANRPLDKLNFVNQADLKYERDWMYNLRTVHTAKWIELTPLGSLSYMRDQQVDGSNEFEKLTSFEVSNSFIFTKDEKFIEGTYKRVSLGSRKPVIGITHTLGVQGVLGSGFNYQKLNVSIDQKVLLGAFGKVKYHFYAGKVMGNAPFPFLNVHAGSESYIIQKNGFNLMSYYEFVSDQWVGMDFEHHLQGVIMDRVPLAKRMKLRTVYTAKVLFGSYSGAGRSVKLPAFSSALNPLKPYTEVSVGIENIFNVLRIDAVWRLSYLDQAPMGVPAPKFGIRLFFATEL